MRYPHILAAIRSAKWAVRPATLQAIRDVLSARLMLERGDSPEHIAAGQIIRTEEFRTRELPRALTRHSSATVIGIQPAPANQVAIVPVFGIIGKRLSDFEMMCGGCDVDEVEANLAEAINDPKVASVILHLDSPGGVVTGVPELAAKIRAWSDQKPIYAFTDTLCASAAYWLAASCAGIFCTPTADVGSIGVYMALIDSSENWAQEGYKLVLIKAGDRKADGIGGAPVAPEAVALWQAECDTIYAMFTGDVRASRPAVAGATMQGQTFMGAAAKTALLVDDVVPDLQSLLAQVLAA